MAQDAATPIEIAVLVRTIAQLLNSFDPSPFRERDIDGPDDLGVFLLQRKEAT